MTSSFDIQPQETVQGIELVSGQRHPCTFKYDSNEILATVYTFDDLPNIKEDQPVFILSEKLKVISLYNNIISGPGRRSGPNIQTTAFWLPIYSNCAIIGTNEWTPTDRIRRVNFRMPNAMRMFWNGEKLRSLSQGRRTEESFEIFSATASLANLRAYYTARGMAWGDGYTDFDCGFEIEFHDAVPLGEHLEYLSIFKWFFSGCLGFLLDDTDRKISRQTQEEFIASVKSRAEIHEHHEIRLGHSLDDPPSHISFHGSPAWGNAADEISNLTNCLVAWMDRLDDWKNTYVHMAGCLRMHREISSERLLSACKWLECIPTASPELVSDNSVIEAMARAAHAAGVESGLEVNLGRVRGILKPLIKESHDARFRRLVSLVWPNNHQSKSRDEFVAELKRSQGLRGAAAHNHIEVRSQEEFADLARVIHAVEALCFLLTMRDLPWSDKARGRLMGHPMTQNYIHSV